MLVACAQEVRYSNLGWGRQLPSLKLLRAISQFLQENSRIIP